MAFNFENKTTKELKETLTLLYFIFYSLLTVIVLLLAITVYGMVAKDNNSTFIALFVVGISCAAILPLQFSSIQKIKAELKRRTH